MSSVHLRSALVLCHYANHAQPPPLPTPPLSATSSTEWPHLPYMEASRRGIHRQRDCKAAPVDGEGGEPPPGGFVRVRLEGEDERVDPRIPRDPQEEGESNPQPKAEGEEGKGGGPLLADEEH